MEMDKNIFALNMSYPEIQIMLLESSFIFSEQCSPVYLLYSQALLWGKQSLAHILPGPQSAESVPLSISLSRSLLISCWLVLGNIPVP